MESVKSGSGQYRKIIIRNRPKMTQHPPGPWRKKLADLSISNMDVNQMKVNLQSIYIASNELDKLTQLKLSTTKIGMTALHASRGTPGVKSVKIEDTMKLKQVYSTVFIAAPHPKD